MGQEWRNGSRCGGLQQRARMVRLATLNVTVVEVSAGACRQIGALWGLVGSGAAGRSAGHCNRCWYRPAELEQSYSSVLGGCGDSLVHLKVLLSAMCVTHRVPAYGMISIANPNYRSQLRKKGFELNPNCSKAYHNIY
jgi:hypothetical protein